MTNNKQNIEQLEKDIIEVIGEEPSVSEEEKQRLEENISEVLAEEESIDISEEILKKIEQEILKTVEEVEKEEIVEAEVEELTEEQNLDIPEVRITLRERVTNLIEKIKPKKEEVKEEKEEIVEVEELTEEQNLDIPEVRITLRERITSLIEKIKSKKEEVKEEKEEIVEAEVEELTEEQNLDIPEVKITLRERVTNLIEKIKTQSVKIKKYNHNSYKLKSLVKTILSGAITSVSVAGILVTASMALSIGLLPTLVITSCYVAAAGMAGYIFKDELNCLKENKAVNKIKNEAEINSNDIPEVKEQAQSKIENLNVNSNVKVSNIRLTKEEKLGKVKNECQINYINNLNTYYISIPKEDILLQRFIRAEIKKEYPEEKIQSFVTEDKKVLVLSKEPGLFR